MEVGRGLVGGGGVVGRAGWGVGERGQRAGRVDRGFGGGRVLRASRASFTLFKII